MSSQSSEPASALISLAEAAELLGVHYMTAYRYVRTGRMYAVKRGGKWWVEQGAVDAVLAEGTGRRSAEGGQRTLRVEPFANRLVAGDAGGCWDLITDALRSGAPPAEVHRMLLHPALVLVGEQWAEGEITIAAEHRATSTANRLIGQMGPLFRHPGRRRGTVVIGTGPGDPHAIPSAMLADLLADRHLDVVDLGANTPATSFLETALEVDDLVGIGICVVLDGRVDQGVELAHALRTALPSVFLVAGGPAVVRARDRFVDVVDQVTESADEACDAFEAAAASSGIHADRESTDGEPESDDAGASEAAEMNEA